MSTLAKAHQDTTELFTAWQKLGDRSARDALAERYLPLARKLARRFDHTSEPFDDLLQVACLGLVKAIDRFDPERGIRFASFAVPTIVGELKRHFRDHGWATHVPRGVQERALLVERAQARLTSELGRPPTVMQLAEHLELPYELVLDALTAGQSYSTQSLDAPNQEDETLGESIGRVDRDLASAATRLTIDKAISHLPERERVVLELRFVQDMTQTEIAERVGVSQMQVSRLLRRSLERLRIMTGEDGPR